MAPEEGQQNAPRRRGRPPGSRNKTTRARRTRGGGAGDLVGQLNAMVAELIKKNRGLQREVARLTERASKTPAGKSVERGLRTISRRVQRALDGGAKRRRKTTTASSNGRRRKATPTRKRRAG